MRLCSAFAAAAAASERAPAAAGARSVTASAARTMEIRARMKGDSSDWQVRNSWSAWKRIGAGCATQIGDSATPFVAVGHRGSGGLRNEDEAVQGDGRPADRREVPDRDRVGPRGGPGSVEDEHA